MAISGVPGFCQEQEQVDRITENFISQAFITALTPGDALNAEKMLVHPLSWSSTRIRGVCRSTLMAEAYALSNAVQHGLRTRAAIVDMRGHLNIREWEETAFASNGICLVDRSAKVSLRIWFHPIANKSTTNVWRLTCQL